MICTTLNAIQAHSPCQDLREKLLLGLSKTKAHDGPLSFSKIVATCGIDDAIWATKSAPEHAKEWRLFAVWCAREAAQYSNDWRVIHAVQIAERYAHGMASKDQLKAVSSAAWDARQAVGGTAGDAARAAAWAASSAAWAAASDEKWNANAGAWQAAYDASVALAIGVAQVTLDVEAARAAARENQEAKFLEIVN